MTKQTNEQGEPPAVRKWVGLIFAIRKMQYKEKLLKWGKV